MLSWSWEREHADRKKENKADAKLHGALPFLVDRKVLKDVVREKMGEEVGNIAFLSSGELHKVFDPVRHLLIIAMSNRYIPQGPPPNPLPIRSPYLSLINTPTGLPHNPMHGSRTRRTRRPSLYATSQDRVGGSDDALDPDTHQYSRAGCVPLRLEPVQPTRRGVHPHVKGMSSSPFYFHSCSLEPLKHALPCVAGYAHVTCILSRRKASR
jgi:hypothetical protein